MEKSILLEMELSNPPEKTMKSNLKFLFVLISVFPFFACSPYVEKTYNVCGSLYLCTDGQNFQNENNFRSAYVKCDTEGLTTIVTADYQPVSGEADKDSISVIPQDNLFFTFRLTAGKWKISSLSYLTAGGSASDPLYVTSQPVEIDVDESSALQIIKLMESPVTDATGTSGIDLPIKVFDYTIVSSMEVHFSGPEPVDSVTRTITSSDCFVLSKDLAAGDYEATFSFKDSGGNLLYECYESIGILPGTRTTTWYNNADSEYFKTESVGGEEKTVLSITEKCLVNFKRTDFYVSSRSVEGTRVGSYERPFENFATALSAVKNRSVENPCTIHLLDAGSIVLDSQFSDFESGGTIKIINENIDENSGERGSVIFQKSSVFTSTASMFKIPERTSVTFININFRGSNISRAYQGEAFYNSGTLTLENCSFYYFYGSITDSRIVFNNVDEGGYLNSSNCSGLD